MSKEMEMKKYFDDELAERVDAFGTFEEIEIMAIMYVLGISYKFAVLELQNIKKVTLSNYVACYFKRHLPQF